MFLVQGIPGDNSNTWYTGRAMTSLKTHGSQQGTWPTPRNWSMPSMPATPTNQSPGGGKSNREDAILWGEGNVTTHAWSWPGPTGWNPQAHWLDPSHATLISGSGNHQGTFHHDITRFRFPSIIFLLWEEVPTVPCMWFWSFGTVWFSHLVYKEAVLQVGSPSSI